jgi:[CysO sulfur-carrier protein]-S-L-cysteine hydrolase
LKVIGSAHSHPSSPPSPSCTDRRLNLGPTLMLIRTGLPVATSPDASAAAALLAPLQAWWLLEPDADRLADLAPVQPLELQLLPDEHPEGTGHLGE